MALRDDLIADGRIERTEHVSPQQRARIAVAESANRQRGQPGEDVVADARARSTHDGDALGKEASGHECEDLYGGLVEPLRVVNDADQRVLLGGLSQ